jgi:hypothetical protein
VQDEGDAPAIEVNGSQGVQVGSGNTQVNNWQSPNPPCSLPDYLEILAKKPSSEQRYAYFIRPEYKEYREHTLIALPPDIAAEIYAAGITSGNEELASAVVFDSLGLQRDTDLLIESTAVREWYLSTVNTDSIAQLLSAASKNDITQAAVLLRKFADMSGWPARSVLMATPSLDWRHRWLEAMPVARCAEILLVLDYLDAASILGQFAPQTAAKIILAPSGRGEWLPHMPNRGSVAATAVEAFRIDPKVAVERVAEAPLSWTSRLLPSLDGDPVLLPAVFVLLPDSHKLVLAALLQLDTTRLSALWPQWSALRTPWPLEAAWNAARAVRTASASAGEADVQLARQTHAGGTFPKLVWATSRALWAWTPEFSKERARIIKFFVLLALLAMILGTLAAVIQFYL